MKRIESIIEVSKENPTYGTSLVEILTRCFLLYGMAKVEWEQLEDKTLIHVFVDLDTFSKDK